MIDDSRAGVEGSGVMYLEGVSLVGMPDEGLEKLQQLCSKQFRKHAPFLDSWLHKALISEICRRANNIASDVMPTLLPGPMEGGWMTIVLDGWDRKRRAEAITELTKATYEVRDYKVGEFLDGLCMNFVFLNQALSSKSYEER